MGDIAKHVTDIVAALQEANDQLRERDERIRKLEEENEQLRDDLRLATSPGFLNAMRIIVESVATAEIDWERIEKVRRLGEG